jgi:quinol monooxygenase YgiN
MALTVLLDTEDASRVILLEQWASADAGVAYRAWRAGEAATELGSLLVGPPQVSQFEIANDI